MTSEHDMAVEMGRAMQYSGVTSLEIVAHENEPSELVVTHADGVSIYQMD